MNQKQFIIRSERDLEAQGVLFFDMDTGLKEHPEIVKNISVA